MISLPSMAAAQLERQGKLTGPRPWPRSRLTTGPNIAADLFRGRSDPQAIERMTAKSPPIPGSIRCFVRRSEGRVDTGTYLREVHRSEGKIGIGLRFERDRLRSLPGSPQQQSNDPILDAIIAPATSAAVDLMTNQVGWKIAARYNLLSYEVNGAWDSRQ